jgi:hypothetical protein
MKVELKFDPEIYNSQINVLFDLAWKNKISYYKNSQYLGFLLIALGSISFYQPHSSFFSIAIVIFGLGIIIPYFYQYFKVKSVYKQLEIQKAEEIKSYENQICTFEFTEEYLISTFQNTETKISWGDFIKYIVEKKNIFIITKNYHPVILGELEVGEQNFENIKSFVAGKISNK